ncbi:hypothetical protein [Methylomonas albis]|uniref:Transmembrane protein n=1 Tax=Methylomonas albis TaxID=1854563 RepID=A0ABR9CXI5_9GAMM|nr:hypothetical protein [Methylomonas albis]MBD9355588.1 hypothetical protein [Methylomonas albis]CAD6878593.1 hypothetical protein [Methylomonas albis]
MSHIDLNNPPPNHTFSVSVDRQETDAERNVRLFKDLALFIVALGFVVLIVWLCYATLVATTTSAEEKKWAMSVLSAATGGIIGYLLRK